MKRPNTLAIPVLLSLLALSFPACKSGDNTIAPPPPGPVWLTYQHATSADLLDDKINSITVDLAGPVWFATDSGASSFSGGNWSSIRDSLAYTTFSTGGAATSYKVTSIAPGNDGSVWFGLAGGGVKRYRALSPHFVWQTYGVPKVPFGTISAISSDAFTQYGNIWVAAPIGGVARYIPSRSIPDEGQWITYTSSDVAAILTNQVRTTAYNDVTNTVWFGTYLGAFSYHEVEGWATVVPPPDKSGVISSIAFDNSNNIWFGMSGGTSLGVTKYNTVSGEFVAYTNASTGGRMPAGPVNAVATNNTTTRWFATDAGLAQLKDTTWTVFTTANTPNLPSDSITALGLDRRSNLWIGTTRGVAVYNESGTRF